LKPVVLKTAAETLGKRRKTARGIKIWNTDTALKIKENKKAYWAFLQSKYATDRTEYKLRSVTVKREIRKINRKH
jgi:hypothetical protein